MKKFAIALMAGVLLPLAGCSAADNTVPTPEEVTQKTDEIIAQVSGPMAMDGNWVNEKDDTMRLLMVETGENTYDATIYWSIDEHSARHWTFSGTYDEASGMLVYENGKYEVLKITPEGMEVSEEAADTTGNLSKIGEETLQWTDSKLSDPRSFTRDENGAFGGIRLAEGPFTVNNTFAAHISEEDKARFEKATNGQIGVGYTPVQVLATQLVNGINYAYLVHGHFVLGKEADTYCIITVNENSSGELSDSLYNFLDVNDVKTAEVAKASGLFGAWKTADNGADGITGVDEADNAFMTAFQNYQDDAQIGKLVPVVLLGSAAENGTVTYRFLVRGTDAEIDPDKTYFVIDIEAKEGGEASVKDITVLDLLSYVTPSEE